jgi:hypothetical protein
MMPFVFEIVPAMATLPSASVVPPVVRSALVGDHRAAAYSEPMGLWDRVACGPRLRRLTALTGPATQPSFATKNSTQRSG